VPALFETLSGMNMGELMSNIKGMKLRPNGSVVVDGKADTKQ
jgi:flotillin